jgi:hypothetical protein
MKLKILFIFLSLSSVTAFALSPDSILEKNYRYHVICKCGFDWGYQYTEYEHKSKTKIKLCADCYATEFRKFIEQEPDIKTIEKIKRQMQQVHKYQYHIVCECGFNFGWRKTEDKDNHNTILHGICDKCYEKYYYKKAKEEDLKRIRESMENAYQNSNIYFINRKQEEIERSV